jgi:hypothetical protein
VAAENDRADEGRVGDHLLRLRREFVLPLQRFVQALQYFRQATGRLAGPDQADEDLVEDAPMIVHGLRQGLATLDRLDQAGHHLAEARMFETVAQVGESFEDGHAGAHQLLQVEAEVNDLPARHATTAQQAAVAERFAADQVELHAPQAQFEVDQVDGVDPAEDHAPIGVDRLVGVERHRCYIRSVRSTTRPISSSEVEPSRTRRRPSSARVAKP